MTIDQKQIISFVQANIEIGQSYSGLSKSSQSFLDYWNKSSIFRACEFDVIGQVTECIQHEKLNFKSEKSLNEFSFQSYKYLSELSYLGLIKNDICLSFGGDHSIALSTVHSSLKYDPDTLVIWIDAHADLNKVDHSLTGNFHGMPVYYLLNPDQRPQSMAWMQSVLKPENLIYIGLRDLDLFEIEYLKSRQITHFTINQIREHGLTQILENLQPKIDSCRNIHCSFDIDSLDKDLNLCTGVPVPGGFLPHEIFQIADWISQSEKLRHFDVVEINPALSQSASDLEDVYDIVIQFINKLISPIPVKLTKENNIEIQGDFHDNFF